MADVWSWLGLMLALGCLLVSPLSATNSSETDRWVCDTGRFLRLSDGLYSAAVSHCNQLASPPLGPRPNPLLNIQVE